MFEDTFLIIDTFPPSENLSSLLGSPVRAMVATTWRSGSTFLGHHHHCHSSSPSSLASSSSELLKYSKFSFSIPGDIMNSHPATYYHYEPLLHYDIKQARYPHLHHDVYAIMMFMLMIMITTRIIIMMMMFLLMIMMIMAARTIMNLEM